MNITLTDEEAGSLTDFFSSVLINETFSFGEGGQLIKDDVWCFVAPHFIGGDQKRALDVIMNQLKVSNPENSPGMTE